MRSIGALQQAMVRLMVDPDWLEALQAGSVPELTEAERALLLAVDPRAWSTDPYRRTRLVQALIEEYPAVTAVLGVKRVEAFLSTPEFAHCLAHRGSMALAFGAWAPTGDLAALEFAIARARRHERAPGPGIVTRPGVEPLVVAGGVIGTYARILHELGPDPLHKLAHGFVSRIQPEFTAEPDGLLIEVDANGAASVGGATVAMVELLQYTCTPRPRPELEARLRGIGLDAREARVQVAEWLDEGLLIARQARS